MNMNGTPGGPKDAEKEPSFEERLRTARGKQGLDAPPRQNQLPSAGWGFGLRVGAELVSALVVAVGIGLLLDRWLHTLPLFLGIFVLLGGAAGIMNVWRLFAPRKLPVRKKRDD
jgi:ATP synthase protein I